TKLRECVQVELPPAEECRALRSRGGRGGAAILHGRRPHEGGTAPAPGTTREVDAAARRQGAGRRRWNCDTRGRRGLAGSRAGGAGIGGRAFRFGSEPWFGGQVGGAQ